MIGNEPLGGLAPESERCIAYLPNVDYVISGNDKLTLRYLTMERKTAIDVVVTDRMEVRRMRRRFAGS